MLSQEAHKRNREYLNQLHGLEKKVQALTEKLLESFEELNILYDASQHLSNIYNINEICAIALNQMAEIVHSEKASILLLDEDREYLTIIYCRGVLSNPVGHKVKIKGTFYNEVFKNRKPLLLEGLEQQFVAGQKKTRYNTNRLILHSICALPMTINGDIIGVISLADKLDKRLFTARDIKFLSAITTHTAMAIQNARLVTNLKESLLITVRSLSAAIDAKDHYTHGHSVRVSEYALNIGRNLGIPQAELTQLEMSSLLHDVGKIGIPENILNKKGKLSSREMNVVRKHPLKGIEILENTKQTKSILAAVRHHHERYDGQGYPDGLVGEQIPLLARIIAVADSYDAMVSDRPYRPRRLPKVAVEEIRKGTGSMYDPKVVWAFLKFIGKNRVPIKTCLGPLGKAQLSLPRSL
jgi:putative nucleotidyltransferase with HDIG domain